VRVNEAEEKGNSRPRRGPRNSYGRY